MEGEEGKETEGRGRERREEGKEEEEGVGEEKWRRQNSLASDELIV